MSDVALIIADTERFPAGMLVRYNVCVGGFNIWRGKVASRLSAKEFANHVQIVPSPAEIAAKLKAKATFGIMWDSTSERFRVVGFRFGEATRISVPVFEDRKVVRTRLVTTTRHISIDASTFDLAMYKLFAACAKGDLYGYYDKGKVERLYWDAELRQFATEVTKLKVKEK